MNDNLKSTPPADVSHLLKPRWKVINDWPGSDNGDWYNVGDILTDPGGRECVRDQWNNPVAAIDFAKYPHLFKPLAWYEERSQNEMPEYIKYCINEEWFYHKISRWEFGELITAYISERVVVTMHEGVLPATQYEYETYINKTK